MKSKLTCYKPLSSTYPNNPASTSFLTLEGNNLLENVSYTQCINSETDLQFGQVASAQITFRTKSIGTGANIIDKTTIIKFESIQENYNDSWRLKGWFYVTDVKKNENTYTVTAYDAVSKLDVDVTNYLKSMTTSITLYTLYQNIISFCKLTNGNSSSFVVNGSYSIIPSTIATASVTARTVMHYIAEACGGFIKAKTDRSIFFDIFGVPSASAETGDTTQEAQVTAKDYTRLTLADKPAPIVSGINIQLASGSCRRGTSNSTSDMVYLFNPLFYNKKEADIASNVQSIYTTRIVNQLSQYNQNGGMYYAANFHLFTDRITFTYNGSTVYKTINAGDVILVDGKTVYVFNKSITDSGCDITCTGDPQRLPVVTENTDRISNLEADAFSDVYVSALSASDIIIPNGLGYPNNTGNTSLIAVIRYILNSLEPSTVDLRMGISGDYHTYNTGYSASTYTYTADGSFTVTNVDGSWVITCTGYTDGHVYIKQSGNTVKTYNCYGYTDVIGTNTTRYIYFSSVAGVDEQTFYYQIYKNGSQVAVGSTPITSSAQLQLESDEPEDCLYFYFKETGQWRIVISNRTSPSEELARYYYYVQ